MKIIILSSFPALPSNEGNRIRILNLTRNIRALGHELFFVYLPTWDIEDIDVDAHQAEFGEDRVFILEGCGTPAKTPFLFRLRRKISRILGFDSAFYNHLDEFFAPEWTQQLAALQDKHSFDAVMVEYVFHSKALFSFPDHVLKIIDTHDRFADRHKLFRHTNNKLGYWLSFRQDVENNGLRRADIIVAIQEEEAEVFRKHLLSHTQPRVVTIGHIDVFKRRITDYGATDATFLGSRNNANLIAYAYFVDKILPEILKHEPLFKLNLVGSICFIVPDHPHVRKLNIVEDLADAFVLGPVLVNPMLVGTGINIKVLDALALAVPVVATQSGVRGLPSDIRDGIRIVEDNDFLGFASEMLTLIRSESLRQFNGHNAFQTSQTLNKNFRTELDAMLEKKF